MSQTIVSLPHPGLKFVTDGGLETDLIFHHGVDLPHFAAFPLLDSSVGRGLLKNYYEGYAQVASAAGAGLLLESPTWRANTDWGDRLGYDAVALARVNAQAVRWLAELRSEYNARDDVPTGPVLVGGMVGPRGDGYRLDKAIDPGEAEAYHRPQVEAFAAEDADLVTAYTLTDVGEAIGVVRAARAVDLPVAISFTVETDGRLPSGMRLADAVHAVDGDAPPDYFLVNCAHPDHIAAGLAVHGDWRSRIRGLRVNASAKTHAELDEAEELDEGDIPDLVRGHASLAKVLPSLSVVGGCCGTDSRHVAALWSA
ncbi:MAG: homocysteine S-methyltransferase family protein [Propionibacteriaceae bacterium]